MSVEENRDYYIVDNGFVSILIDKQTHEPVNTRELEDAYGGRTLAYNNAIAYAKRRASEYEENKKNEIRIVEPNAKNEEDWDWVQNADFTTNEFFRIGVKTLFDVKPGEVVNVTTTKGKVRIHVR